MRALLFLVLVFFLVACGIFNKTKHIDKTRIKKDKLEIVKEEAGITVKTEELNTEFTELVIRMPADNDIASIEEYESLYDALVAAIQNSETTTLRTNKTNEKRSSKVDTTKTDKSIAEHLDSLKTEKAIQKDSDTTWLANFNPWVILGVAAMVIGAMFLYFKMKRPL